MTTRPVWAEISLPRLRSNYQTLWRSAAQALGAGTAPHLVAVVKANAYGHGVELCGPALAAAGAGWLGVTSVEEGMALRRALGVLPPHLAAVRILVMSSLWHGQADAVLDLALTPQVWEPYQLSLLAAAATARHLGPASVPVHLEIDTGMGRQGVTPGSPLAALLTHLSADSPLSIEGVMTHFSAPEVLDAPNHGLAETDIQVARFSSALDQLAEAGVRPALIHAGNSATVFDSACTSALASLAANHGAQLLLRPGLALYGYPVRFRSSAPRSPTAPRHALHSRGPASDATQATLTQDELHPVLAFKSRIVSLRTLASGNGAGYNSTFRAGRPSRIALTPVGYADGLDRLLSNPQPSPASAMLVRGQRAPIAGRISMDQTMLDVTDIPGAAIGDEVVILGNQGDRSIDAWEHADLCNTIPYEILCSVAARVPRIAVD